MPSLRVSSVLKGILTVYAACLVKNVIMNEIWGIRGFVGKEEKGRSMYKESRKVPATCLEQGFTQVHSGLWLMAEAECGVLPRFTVAARSLIQHRRHRIIKSGWIVVTWCIVSACATSVQGQFVRFKCTVQRLG